MSFVPPFGLGNRHIQTIFSSVGPRRARVRRAFKPHQIQEQDVILKCHDDIRLSGILNLAGNSPASKLVIMIHGWEGSAGSSYMLSMTTRLLEQGIDVFRLNLRDHGQSHHLNRGIFNSTLLPEVLSGLEDLQARYSYQSYSLVGFSLGGNFALRVAAAAHDRAIELSKVIVFCPALHAARSNVLLNSPANYVYGQYFVRKWKSSLLKKLEYFPDYEYRSKLDDMNTLDQMNAALIPEYTEFDNIESYFDAYAVVGDVLKNTICPCYLHFSKDDMMIPYEDIKQLAYNPKLDITLTEKGGHCGFLMNWKLDTWQDYRVMELIRNY